MLHYDLTHQIINKMTNVFNKHNEKEDDNVEVLEFYIGLIQEIVENFKKEKNHNKQVLNDFIAEYIDLEDKIIGLIEKISQSVDVNEEQMEKLTDTFNKYFGDFQNEWPEEYWEIYHMYRNLNDKELFNQLNKKTLTENSFLEDQKNKILDKSGLCHLPSSRRSSFKFGNFDDGISVSGMQLEKIDAEIAMADVPTSASSPIQRKEEKNRSCVNCIVF